MIVSVQQKNVAQPGDVQKQFDLARQQDRRSVLLLVQGADGMRWVPLPMRKNND